MTDHARNQPFHEQDPMVVFYSLSRKFVQKRKMRTELRRKRKKLSITASRLAITSG